MAQIEQVVKQIQSEFRLDGNGQAFVSIRGAARLADIDPTGLSKNLVSGVDSRQLQGKRSPFRQLLQCALQVQTY